MVTSEKVSWHLHAGPQGTQGLSGALCTMGSTAVVGEDEGAGQACSPMNTWLKHGGCWQAHGSSFAHWLTAHQHQW